MFKYRGYCFFVFGLLTYHVWTYTQKTGFLGGFVVLEVYGNSATENTLLYRQRLLMQYSQKAAVCNIVWPQPRRHPDHRRLPIVLAVL